MKDQLLVNIRENIFETASWILDLEDNDREKVKEFILSNGMKSFLLHHEELDLSEFDHEKVEVLKRVIAKYDGEIESIDFVRIEMNYGSHASPGIYNRSNFNDLMK
jgi:hypothetical protein